MTYRLTASIQLLSLSMSGEKIIDCTYEGASFRLQTRTDGGIDLVVLGKDRHGGVTHIKCDTAALISAISDGISKHKFESVKDPTPSVLIRGHIDPSSEDLPMTTNRLDVIPQDTARLNREKWEREVAYLNRIRELSNITESTCTGTLSKFGNRNFRRRA